MVIYYPHAIEFFLWCVYYTETTDRSCRSLGRAGFLILAMSGADRAPTRALRAGGGGGRRPFFFSRVVLSLPGPRPHKHIHTRCLRFSRTRAAREARARREPREVSCVATAPSAVAEPSTTPESQRGGFFMRSPCSSCTKPSPGPTWRTTTRKAGASPARLSPGTFSGPYARGVHT